jgi:hypothetical protein
MGKLSRKAQITSIWLLVSGGLAIIGTLLAALVVWTLAEGMALGQVESRVISEVVILGMALLLALPGVVVVMGGLSAAKGRHWNIVLAGALCGVLYFNILAVPPLVLLFLCRSEFRTAQVGRE